jgi:hypothetical protein
METTTKEKTCCGPSCCEGDNPAANARAENEKNAVRDTVKERYGNAVKAVMQGAKPSCCGSSAAPGIAGTDPITRGLYDVTQTEGSQRTLSLRPSDAETRPPSRSSHRGKPSSTSAREVASTCSSPPRGWAPLARPMGST